MSDSTIIITLICFIIGCIGLQYPTLGFLLFTSIVLLAILAYSALQLVLSFAKSIKR